jgi:DNA-binding beta-propeller fold protein YncE
MKRMSVACSAVCAGAAVVAFAACAGGGVGGPSGPTGVRSDPAAAAADRGERGRSWMAPDARNGDLLYVADGGTGDVDVYSYPSAQTEGVLTGFAAPHGECVDKAGNVFITNTGASDILEYAHAGTTPIASLPDAGYSPVGCAVDPTTGDLAVTNLTVATGSGPGNLLIFRHAKGTPKIYTTQNVYYYYFCGYDDTGNLYVDGNTQHIGAFEFAELPVGRKNFKSITLNQTIQMPGGVQWDGKYVAVEDRGVASQGSVIYQFAIHGSAGTEAGTTPLTGSTEVSTFWIQGATVIGPNAAGNVLFWHYPAGGAAKKTIDGFGNPLGVTVSRQT